jgi:predicted O-methyltransferase YrrM
MAVVIRLAFIVSAALFITVIVLESAGIRGASSILLILASALTIVAIVLILRRQNQAQSKLVVAVSSLASELDKTHRLLCDLFEQIGGESKATRDEYARGAALPGWSAQKWEQLYQRVTPGKVSIEQRARSLIARDMNALLTLHGLVSPTGELPQTTSYAATPETVLALVGLVPELSPEAVIVEAGSGVSTAWLALAAEQFHRPLQIISLEQDSDYAEATRAALDRQGLSPETKVEVRFAPLVATPVEGDEQPWYAPDSYADISRIDVLFVDGPTASTGESARYPAVPLLEDRLVDGAVVILDDIDRQDEQQVLERWLARNRRGMLRVERELDRAVLLRYSLAQR